MLLAFYNVNRMLHACHVIYFGKRARCHFKCHLLLFMRIHFFCNLQYQGVLFLISPSPQLVRIFLINKVTCYANKCFLICLIPSYLYRLFYSLKEGNLLHNVHNNIFCVSYFNKNSALAINTYKDVSYLLTLVSKFLKARNIFYESLCKKGPYSYVLEHNPNLFVLLCIHWIHVYLNVFELYMQMNLNLKTSLNCQSYVNYMRVSGICPKLLKQFYTRLSLVHINRILI